MISFIRLHLHGSGKTCTIWEQKKGRRKRKCRILLVDFLAVEEAMGAALGDMGPLPLDPLTALPVPISQDHPAISITMVILDLTPFSPTSILPLGEEGALALI